MPNYQTRLLTDNPNLVSYKPTLNGTAPPEISWGTPMIGTSVPPMRRQVGAPAGYEDMLVPSVGYCLQVSWKILTEAAETSEGEIRPTHYTQITSGPRTRPYETSFTDDLGNSVDAVYQSVAVANSTPFEYFESDCLSLIRSSQGFYSVVSGSTPLYIGEVTTTISDDTVGAVKLGYSRHEALEAGDSLPDPHWLQQFSDKTDMSSTLEDVIRPCANYLAGGDISVGTKCLVEQEAGGLWTVVAVEC